MIFQNKTLILASTLAFLVCSSKNIIIYNEEILVALSFLFFVLFSFYSFQDSVKMTFDERRKAIMQDMMLKIQIHLSLVRDTGHIRLSGLRYATRIIIGI